LAVKEIVLAEMNWALMCFGQTTGAWKEIARRARRSARSSCGTVR